MWTDVLLLSIVVICAATDLMRRKIYNIVIFLAVAAAFIGHACMNGWAGLGFSFGGLAAGLGILLIPYLAGGIGAGDVKLLAAVGAFKGGAFAVTTAIYMGFIGSGLALVYLLLHKQSRERVRRLFTGVIYAVYASRFGGGKIVFSPEERDSREMLPYGVAIGGGAVLAAMWGGLWG